MGLRGRERGGGGGEGVDERMCVTAWHGIVLHDIYVTYITVHTALAFKAR